MQRRAIEHDLAAMFIDLMPPLARLVPAVDLDPAAILSDQDVIAQRRERAIGDELFTPIGQFSARREHLGDQTGRSFIEWLGIL